MKTFLVSFLILTATPALAATAPTLQPGKPAGVKAAQLDDGGRGMLIVAGVAAVGIGIALATAGDGPAAAPAATSPPTTTP